MEVLIQIVLILIGAEPVPPPNPPAGPCDTTTDGGDTVRKSPVG